MHGSVFSIGFMILFKESESIETSPGFAWFLGEKWGFQSQLQLTCM